MIRFFRRNPGRDLARIHAENCRRKREAEHDRILATTRAMRVELALSRHPALGG